MKMQNTVIIAVMTLIHVMVASAQAATSFLIEIPQAIPATSFNTPATHAGVLIQNTTTEPLSFTVEGFDIPTLGNNLPGFWAINNELGLAETVSQQNSFLGGESFLVTLPSLSAVSIYAEIPVSGIFATLPRGDRGRINEASGLQFIGDQYTGPLGFYGNGVDISYPFQLRGGVAGVVPEPSSALLILCGGILSVLRRRRS